MPIFSTILLLFYLLTTNLIGQEVSLTGGFLPYETYYIGSIDLATGKTDVQLFNFLVSRDPPYDHSDPNAHPINFHAEFKFEILSPELGFSEKETLLEIKTVYKISLKDPIYLDNRAFNINNTDIIDIGGNPVTAVDDAGNEQQIAFDLINEVLDFEIYDDMLNTIVTMGRLPDGIYYSSIKLFDFSTGQTDLTETKIINVTTPTSLNLIYPGGALTDTAENIIYTPYPVFQWSTETCISCGLFIRVSEFDPALHSSLEEAIEDITILPIDQIVGWQEIIGSGMSFQYPVLGAQELESGKLYVWQIKKTLPTTLGTDAYLSPISIFKLAGYATTNQEDVFSTSTQSLSSPILIALQNLLGEEIFDTYFGDNGEFSNFSPNGTYRINKETTNSNDILQILDQLKQGTISVVNISVE